VARDMREDVESWDVQVERRWPCFRIDGQPEGSIPPDVKVYISVRFLNEASALEFETQVRGLLTTGCPCHG